MPSLSFLPVVRCRKTPWGFLGIVFTKHKLLLVLSWTNWTNSYQLNAPQWPQHHFIGTNSTLNSVFRSLIYEKHFSSASIFNQAIHTLLREMKVAWLTHTVQWKVNFLWLNSSSSWTWRLKDMSKWKWLLAKVIQMKVTAVHPMLPERNLALKVLHQLQNPVNEAIWLTKTRRPSLLRRIVWSA